MVATPRATSSGTPSGTPRRATSRRRVKKRRVGGAKKLSKARAPLSPMNANSPLQQRAALGTPSKLGRDRIHQLKSHRVASSPAPAAAAAAATVAAAAPVAPVATTPRKVATRTPSKLSTTRTPSRLSKSMLKEAARKYPIPGPRPTKQARAAAAAIAPVAEATLVHPNVTRATRRTSGGPTQRKRWSLNSLLKGADVESDEESSEAADGAASAPAALATAAPATTATAATPAPPTFSTASEIKVFVRLRPQSDAEKADPTEIVTVAVGDDGKTVVLTAPDDSAAQRHGKVKENFTFTHVFGPSTTQEQLFESAIRPLVDAMLPPISGGSDATGQSSVIFAYGVSNSGKSHTIRGTDTNPGMVPQAIRHVLDQVGALPAGTNLSLQMLEVYNDKPRDLLVARKKTADSSSSVTIRHSTEVVRVDGLVHYALESADAALGIIKRAYTNSSTSSTKFNSESSRGHVITIINLLDGKTVGNYHMPQSQLIVVDMGGVERVKKTGVAGERLKESIGINKSLMQVVRCLETLKWNEQHPEQKPKMIPIRESALTHLLGPAFSGRMGTGASVAIVLTAAPGVADYDEKTSAFRAMMPAMGIKTGSAGNKTERKTMDCHNTNWTPRPKMRRQSLANGLPADSPSARGRGWSLAKNLLRKSVRSGLRGTPSRGARRSSFAQLSTPIAAAPAPKMETMGTSPLGTPMAEWSSRPALTTTMASSFVERTIQHAVARAQISIIASEKAAAAAEVAEIKAELAAVQKQQREQVAEATTARKEAEMDVARLVIALEDSSSELAEAGRIKIELEAALQTLDASLTTETTRTAALEASKEAIRAEFATAEASHAVLVEESTTKLASLNADLAKAQQQQAEVAAEAFSHKRAAEAGAERIEEYSRTCEQLTWQCNESAEALSALQVGYDAQCAAAKESRVMLEMHVTQLQQDATTASEELSAARTSRDELATVKITLQKKLAIAKNLVKNRHAALGKVQLQLGEERSARASQSEEHIAEIAKCNAALQEVQSQHDAVAVQLVAQEAATVAAEAHCATLTAECAASAEALIAQSEAHRVEALASKSECKAMQTEIVQLQQSLSFGASELSDAVASNAVLTAAGKDLGVKLAASTALASQRSAALEALASNLARATTHYDLCAEKNAVEFDELSAAKTASENALLALQKEHSGHVTASSEQFEAMSTQLSTLQSAMDAKSIDLENMHSSANVAAKQSTKLARKLTAAIKLAKERHASNGILSAKLVQNEEMRRSNVQRLEIRAKMMDSRIAEAHVEQKTLQAQLENESAAANAATAKATAIALQFAACRTELSVATVEGSALSASYATLSQKMQQVEAESLALVVASKATNEANVTRITALQSELSATTSELRVVVESREALTVQSEALQSQLAESVASTEAHIAAQTAIRAELAMAAASHASLLTKSTDERATLNASLADAQEQQAAVAAELTKHAAIAEEGAVRAEEYRVKCEQLEQQCSESAEALGVLQSEYDAQCAAAKESRTTLETHVDLLQQDATNASEELSAARKSRDELATVKTTLQKKLAITTKLMKDRRAALGEMKLELDEERSASAALTEEHKAALTACNSAVEQLQSQCDAAASTRNAEAAATVAAEARCAALTAKCAASIEALAAQSEEHAAENAKCNAALQEAQSEHDAVAVQLVAAEASTVAAAAHCATLTAECAASAEALIAQNKAHRSATLSLKCECEAMEAQISTLQHSHDTIAAEFDAAKATNAALSLSGKQLESKLAAFTNLANERSEALGALMEELATVRSELAAKEMALHSADANSSASAAQNATLAKQLTAATASNVAKESAMAALQEEHSAYVEKTSSQSEATGRHLYQLRSELDATVRSLATMEEKSAVASDLIREGQSTKEALESTVEKMSTAHSEGMLAVQEQSRLRQEKDAATNAALESKLVDLQSRHRDALIENDEGRQDARRAAVKHEGIVSELNGQNSELWSERDELERQARGLELQKASLEAVFATRLAKFKQEKDALRSANYALRLHARAVRSHKNALQSQLESRSAMMAVAVEAEAEEEEEDEEILIAPVGVPLLPVPVEKSSWAHDHSASHCKLCTDKFTLFRRRHHCRSCGEIFCASCSSTKLSYPWLDITEKTRACRVCFNAIKPKIERWEEACSTLLQTEK